MRSVYNFIIGIWGVFRTLLKIYDEAFFWKYQTACCLQPFSQNNCIDVWQGPKDASWYYCILIVDFSPAASKVWASNMLFRQSMNETDVWIHLFLISTETLIKANWRRSGVSIVSFGHISHLVLVFLLLTLSR